jgi:hypothetical protein
MIVLYVLFIIIIMMISIFIGLQLASNIEDPTLYVLFWIVYLIVCMSLANGIAITYFWDIVKKKTGPPGPRGPDGDIGKTGLKGKCNETCSVKTCSFNLRKVIENKLKALSGQDSVSISNQMILYKLDQMCNSKDYEIIAPMKGPNNIQKYMSDLWEKWIELLYKAGGLEFFNDAAAEDDYKWRDGNNPFDEISKYDLWSWGLTRDFEPIAIEICDEPSKSNEFPQIDKPRFKYVYTNCYDWVLDDYKSRAKQDLSVWVASNAVVDHEYYYPVGFIAVGPARRGERGSARKFIGNTTISRSNGPDKSTIIVTGDVQPPIDYIWKWNSEGSRMYWGASMWTPVPPPGYVCMGDVMVKGFNKPPLGKNAPIRCIPAKYVNVIPNSGNTLIWCDRGSRAYSDGSIFGMTNGAWAQGNHDNAYNLFRCVRGYPRTMGTGSFPLYKINDKALLKIETHIKTVEQRYSNNALGWHGSPSRDSKYSIFTFLGLVPEGIVMAKSSSRKYYIIHSGDYYHDDNKNTQIPLNSYIILHWNEDSNDFTLALTAFGNNEVLLLDKTLTDIRQQWEVVFIGDSITEFRFKSRDSGFYLYDKPKANLRGANIYMQVQLSETATNYNKIEPYTVFVDTKPAFGVPLNRIKPPIVEVEGEGEEVKQKIIEYKDIKNIPKPTYYPSRVITDIYEEPILPPVPTSPPVVVQRPLEAMCTIL